MFKGNVWLDFETYNEQSIRVGTYRYAETAEVLLAAYALDDGPVKVWDCTQEPFPTDLQDWMFDDDLSLTAYNAIFDRNIARYALGISARRKRWRCTMVKALSHALPGSLDQCCKILGLPSDQAKLADGKKLIHRFCAPAPKNHKAARYDRTTHPAEWDRFKAYAAQDIVAMREVDKRLPDWNWRDRDVALYHLDQTINDRGFQVDRDLVTAGAQAAVAEQARLADRFTRLTGGAVTSPGQREKFKAYLKLTFGLELENTQAETLRTVLTEQNLDPNLRRLIEIATHFNKASTAKYKALLPAISADGRFRGALQFRGAARTRRWSGRGFQPHNLPSRGLPPPRDTDCYIRALKAGCHDYLFDRLMHHGAAALRGVLIAPDGRRLAVADLANIEGRILAWLAGERWKLDAFQAYDAGQGPDLYRITAASILGGRPDDIGKQDRDVFGKVPDLACGYGGGFGAFDTFAGAYGVRIADHWATIRRSIDPAHVTAAESNYHVWGADKHPEADRTGWIAADAVKLAWRARHPKTVQLWRACEAAARLAVQHPGRAYRAGPHLKYAVKAHAGTSYLLCRLPSGNFLTYFAPRYDATRDTLSYMGVDRAGGAAGAWRRQTTYGGKLVENAGQSIALDILAHNMPAIEAAGFRIVLTVHDEIVAEAPPDKNAADLAALMATSPPWLPDFPLAAAGFDCERYRKG